MIHNIQFSMYEINFHSIHYGNFKTRFIYHKEYSNFLKEDHTLRSYIEKNYSSAGISSVIIERAASNLKIIIHTSKPGVLIGKKGADIEKLRNSLSKLSNKNISLDIKEIKKPETDASLVADSIARQLEKRIAFRKAMKKSDMSAIKLGAKGIKIVCGGRLGGCGCQSI